MHDPAPTTQIKQDRQTGTMKKLPALFYAIACTITVSSCMHNDHNVSLSVSESDRYYSMNAHFSRSKTKALEQYMDRELGRQSNMSFRNAQIDGTMALDDSTTFSVKKSPGVLKIKLDKDENSDEALARVRSMCEGMKEVLAK